MSDDFEDLLKRWLRDRSRTDRSTLQALAGNVAALPPRRRNRPSRLLPLAAAIVVVLGAIAFLAPRLGNVGGEVDPAVSPSADASQGSTLPGGPEAFVGDPRLNRCAGTPDDMEFVFVMSHARDYRLYLPAMLLAPELDVDAAALVVVYRGLNPMPYTGPSGVGTRPPLGPTERDFCVVVGEAPHAEVGYYDAVDITGLTVDVSPSSAEPTSSASLEPTGSPASPTVAPLPAWTADLAGQLGCDGPIADIGGEYPDAFGRPDASAVTAEAALKAFLGPGNPFASLPVTGYVPLHQEPHWASFGHLVDGRPKAIILLTDASVLGPGWTVVALRACDASEFDPAVPLTFPVTVWTDASGDPVSTETIRSNPGPGHCGWESATWLHVDGELYFRDPEGVMAEWTATPFDADASLPPTATDTGYRSGDIAVWLDPGGDAYLVLPGRVERWPRSTDPFIGCL